MTPDEKLADELAKFYADPLGFVMFAFPWDSDLALQVVDWEAEDIFVDPKKGLIYDEKPDHISTIAYKEWMEPYAKRFNCRFGPDKWACEYLDGVGELVKKNKFNGFKSVPPIQQATSSGHGIGKSTIVAWIILWISSTRPFSKGTVTANTAEQLRTKTWAELGKWFRRSIVSHWFRYSSGRGSMSLRHNQHPEEWFCSAQTCREENSEAFAGQHAANSTSYYIFDEASNVPDKIYEVREGGTTDGEPMVFDFGNPTRNSGRFFEECEGRLKHRYKVRKIDSRTVVITNKKRIQEWIDDFGIDSDFVKVRVLGEFPSAGSLQFVPSAWVKRAMLRELVMDRFAAATIGVDVARFGDDSSIIYPLVGRDARSFAPRSGDGIYNGLDNVQLANKVMEKIHYFEGLGIEVKAVFIDVGGTGSGVVDTLNHSGYAHLVVPVNFGNSPVFEPEKYRYRGDELWGRGRDAIKEDLVLPELPGLSVASDETMDQHSRDTAIKLLADLTQREFGYTLQGDKIHLETKKDMKSRGLSSPDLADALFLNFAQDIARVAKPHGMQTSLSMSEHEFDPYDGMKVA